MGTGRGKVMSIGLASAAVVVLSGCSGLVFVANDISQGITEFEAVPNEGQRAARRGLRLTRPAASEPDCRSPSTVEFVTSMPCADERYNYAFTEPGAYEVVLRNTRLRRLG